MIKCDSITLSDISAVITVILVFIGGCFTYYQWKKSNALKRAEYINDLIEKTRVDENIRTVMSKIDYGKLRYDKDFHNGGDLEKKIDLTLAYFSYICYLKKQKLITSNEFIFFHYGVSRILQNSEVKNYLYNLYHFSNKFQKPMSFQYLFDYGKENKFFEEDFLNSNSKNYPHYLNF